MEVVGHRGARLLVPENTLPSFEKAIELGCDRTECDVRLTADGVLVVMHDETVDRTTNGTGLVSELTLDEIRSLDAGNGAQVPTLEEVLELVAGRIRLLCELKGEGTAAPAVAMVREHGLVDEVVFTCFDFDRLAEARALGKDLALGGILSAPSAPAIDRLVALGAVSVGVQYEKLDEAFIHYVRARGLFIRAWNPNSEADIRRVVAMRPDGVSSDRPDLALRIVREQG